VIALYSISDWTIAKGVFTGSRARILAIDPRLAATEHGGGGRSALAEIVLQMASPAT
jgi:hypothetical protein